MNPDHAPSPASASPNGCEEFEPLVAARPLGVLEADEIARLEQHLKACDSCLKLEANIARSLGALVATAVPAGGVERAGRTEASEGALASPVSAPEGAWDKLSQRIRDAQASESTVQVRITLACTFCHAALARDESIFCAACLAPHHQDCFSDHARCAAPGCGETRTVRPQPVRPRLASVPGGAGLTSPVPLPSLAAGGRGASATPPTIAADANAGRWSAKDAAPLVFVAAVALGFGGVAALAFRPGPKPAYPIASASAPIAPSPAPSMPALTAAPTAPGEAGFIEVFVAASDLEPGSWLGPRAVTCARLPAAVVTANPDRVESAEELEDMVTTTPLRIGQIITRSVIRDAVPDPRLTITKVTPQSHPGTPVDVEGVTTIPDGLTVDVRLAYRERSIVRAVVGTQRVKIKDGKWKASFFFFKGIPSGNYWISAQFAIEKQSAVDLKHAWPTEMGREEHRSWLAIRAQMSWVQGDAQTAAVEDEQLVRAGREFVAKVTDDFETLERAYCSAGRSYFRKATGSGADEEAWLRWVKERGGSPTAAELATLALDNRFVNAGGAFHTSAWESWLKTLWIPQLETAMHLRSKIGDRFSFPRDPQVVQETEELIAILRKLVRIDTSELFMKAKVEIPSGLDQQLDFDGEKFETANASRSAYENHRARLLERLDALQPKTPR